MKSIRTTEVESVAPKKRGVWRFVWLPVALLLALSAGGLTGVLTSYYLNNSRYSTEVSALATYRPPQVTTIYADDGETILAEFAHRKTNSDQGIRIFRQTVEDALIAVEDYRFYTITSGLILIVMAGAMVLKNVTTGSNGRSFDNYAATC